MHIHIQEYIGNAWSVCIRPIQECSKALIYETIASVEENGQIIFSLLNRQFTRPTAQGRDRPVPIYIYMYIHVYIYLYKCIYIYIYIYIYI